MGIGGSVIFSTKRGSAKSGGNENEYFTASVIGSVALAVLAWVGLLLFERPILTFFGADEALLALAKEYVRPIRFVFPLFLFNQMLAAFLQNDGDPGLATLGVLAGGIFNIFGDYFFVFSCDMDIFGAGFATAIGSGISVLRHADAFSAPQKYSPAGPAGTAASKSCAKSPSPAFQPFSSTSPWAF